MRNHAACDLKMASLERSMLWSASIYIWFQSLKNKCFIPPPAIKIYVIIFFILLLEFVKDYSTVEKDAIENLLFCGFIVTIHGDKYDGGSIHDLFYETTLGAWLFSPEYDTILPFTITLGILWKLSLSSLHHTNICHKPYKKNLYFASLLSYLLAQFLYWGAAEQYKSLRCVDKRLTSFLYSLISNQVLFFTFKRSYTQNIFCRHWRSFNVFGIV